MEAPSLCFLMVSRLQLMRRCPLQSATWLSIAVIYPPYINNKLIDVRDSPLSKFMVFNACCRSRCGVPYV